MDAKKTLEGFKRKVDPEIKNYFQKVIQEVDGIDANIADALRHSEKIIMSGGKRARAAFMYYGYILAGGKDKRKMLQASISIELVHAFLLMHDDIIDKDDYRHGTETMHARYEKIGKRFLRSANPEHFGSSMAIIAGDMLGALGNQVLFESKFAPEMIVKALIKLQKIIALTVVGESQDIYIENRGYASEEDILKMYENKTAKYTIEGPLHLGAILAEADGKLLKILSEYAVPVGIAFQIQDDILGVFGSEEKLGKPVGSDVRQGKQTILVAKALEKASFSQKKELKKYLGKTDLNQKDLDNFRKIIKDTGALAYAENMAAKLIADGKRALEKATGNEGAKEFLLGIADYMLRRKK